VAPGKPSRELGELDHGNGDRLFMGTLRLWIAWCGLGQPD
jgi:hypothetical protein